MTGSDGRDQEFGELAPVAERLETYATHASPMPSADFTDRVMAAVRREPAPTPARTFLRALGAFSPILVARAFTANVRVLAGAGRMPLAVRAQALAVVMLGILVVGTGGGLAAAGAAALLRVADASPAPSPVPSLDARPSLSPSSSASPSPIPEPTASVTAVPGRTIPPTAASTATARLTPTPTADDRTPRPTATVRPTRTPRETETPRPTDTPRPTRTPDDTERPDRPARRDPRKPRARPTRRNPPRRTTAVPAAAETHRQGVGGSTQLSDAGRHWLTGDASGCPSCRSGGRRSGHEPATSTSGRHHVPGVHQRCNRADEPRTKPPAGPAGGSSPAECSPAGQDGGETGPPTHLSRCSFAGLITR